VVQTASVTQGTPRSGGDDHSGGGGGGLGGSIFAYQMSNCCSVAHPTSQTPYIPSTAAIPLSAVIGFKPAAAGVIGGLPVIQAGVGVAGSGAGQTSAFLVMAGMLHDGSLSGAFFASGRGPGDEGQSVGSGAFSATGATSAIIGAGSGATIGAGPGRGGTVPGAAVSTVPPTGTAASPSPEPIPSSGTIQSATASLSNGGGAVPQPPTSYSFAQRFSRITPPAALGKVRPDIPSYFGFAGGIMDTINHAKGTTQHFTVGSGFLGFFLLADRGSGFVYSFADVQKVDGGGSAPFDGVYGFGFDFSTSAKNFYRGAYIDEDHFAALDARGDGGKPLSLVNGTTVKAGSGGMVSAGMADLSQLSNYHPCKCEYTKWGFWAVQDVRPGGNIEDRSHLMEWVAGKMPDELGKDIPTTGKASYGGHVVASIQNGDAAYVAAGRFRSTVDFGGNAGTVGVKGLDGVNYKGRIALSASNRATFGTVKAMVGRDAATNAATKLRMSANGAFFGPKADPVREMGGNVTIHGLTPGGQRYLGSGIFAAAK
jgi:hypothetical protein